MNELTGLILPGILLAAQFLIGWAIWSIRSAFVSRVEMQSDRAALKQLESRVDYLERAIGALPTHQDLSHLREQIVGVHGALREVGAEIRALREHSESIEKSVNRIQSYLLKGGS